MTPEQLAAQLRCPSGDDGAQVADNMNQHNQPIIAASYQALAPSAGDHIVEVGPGTAGHLPDLLAMADDLHYTGLDLSPDMVTQAQQHHSHLERVRFLAGDLHDAPLAPGSADHAVAINVVYFWDPLLPALRAIRTLLRPGGQLCLGLRDRHSMATLPVFRHGFLTYDGPDLQQALKTAGFVDVRQQIIPEQSINVMGQVMHKTGLVITARNPEVIP
ncbi:class I SAM-dependent methyltransferase [uncultured Alcanivorax sp.]|uniref:class I SAM-dependent methyltransferase n=1 Tax=Alcanivorax sp. IL2 TaxID=3396310 RepID=UPI0026167D4E|nr:class I SAM-dependent methyltransferase [uncultured Alcanivorax sp.]